MYALQKREKEILALLGEAGDNGMNNVEVAKAIEINKHSAEIFLHLLRGSSLVVYSHEKCRYIINKAGRAYLASQEKQQAQPAQMRFEL